MNHGGATARKNSRARRRHKTVDRGGGNNARTANAPQQHAPPFQPNRRMSCCERLRNRGIKMYYHLTWQTNTWKELKKTRKKQARQRIREEKALQNAPLIANGLSYTQPFLRGEPQNPTLQMDRPIAAGDIPIIYHSDRLVVVHKPSPIPSQKNQAYARAHMRAVLKRQLNHSGRFAALHRLDVCTTGVMLWSPDKEGIQVFSKKIRERDVQKIYLSLVRGAFPAEPRMCNEDVDGKESLTHFYRLELDQATVEANRKMMAATKTRRRRGGGSGNNAHDDGGGGDDEEVFSLVCCVPRTGRKHQIRKHLKFLGYPIANDPRHGGHAGLQYNNHDAGLGIYRDPTLVQLFRQAWATYKDMPHLKGWEELKQHVKCCDLAAARPDDSGDGDGDGDGEEGSGQKERPWNMMWLGPIYLHAWMYYGVGGLKSNEDTAPWCFRAQRPEWAATFDMDGLPPGVKDQCNLPSTRTA